MKTISYYISMVVILAATIFIPNSEDMMWYNLSTLTF